jgi:hypothetical protein
LVPFIRLPVLSRRDAICPQVAMDYVVFSRVPDMVCSPGMVALLVISGVSSADHKQAGAVTVRGSASMNLGGS